MSYTTMQDALFALDLTHSELLDRPKLHRDAPEAQPELPEERIEPRSPAQRRGPDASHRANIAS